MRGKQVLLDHRKIETNKASKAMMSKTYTSIYRERERNREKQRQTDREEESELDREKGLVET